MNLYLWKHGRHLLMVCAESIEAARAIHEKEQEHRFAGYPDGTREHFIRNRLPETKTSPDCVMPLAEPWVKEIWTTEEGAIE